MQFSEARPRLAIISTFDELCGIAGYTKALVPQLTKDFDIEVFDLDQFLFRHVSKKIQNLADKEILRICNAISKFDCVNIQLEHGTFGRDAKDIYRRLNKIFNAAPKIAITFHTVLTGESFTPNDFYKVMRKSGFFAAMAASKGAKRDSLLGAGIYKAIAKLQNKKPASVIMHTKRDARMVSVVYGINNVHDHPLAFYSQEFSESIYSELSRDDFKQLSHIKDTDYILGCFGFLGRYKGIDTAIGALKLLPKNYHLAIFGGVHPNEIKKNQPIDPFLQELIALTSPGRKLLDSTTDTDKSQLSLRLNSSEMIDLSSARHPTDISDRVHYMGALSDNDFAKAMAVCDTVLLPYLEVGQSSSGPMSIAVDMGKQLIAARNKAFMQFNRYHPNRFSMFEVGNHVQLSQLIASQASKPPKHYPHPAVNTLTNAETYSKALFLIS
jgi:glycosyltransferase involved in cell wall biosynthesis